MKSNYKKRLLISIVLVVVIIFSFNLVAFAAGSQVASYSSLRTGPDYRGSSSPTFYISTGTIYNYNTFSYSSGSADYLYIDLVNSSGVIYSTNLVSVPAGSGTKASTVYWTSVPTGNYTLSFRSSRVGLCSGTIYNGPK